MSSKDVITRERLERALIVCAQMVEAYGEIWLPHFELVEREYEEFLRRGSAKNRAVRLAVTGDLSSYRDKLTDRS